MEQPAMRIIYYGYNLPTEVKYIASEGIFSGCWGGHWKRRGDMFIFTKDYLPKSANAKNTIVI